MKKYIFLTTVFLSALSISSYAQSWSLTGNSGTNPSTNFVGTKDNQSLVFKTNNKEQLRITAAGRFGIGIAAPSQRLDVKGNINLAKGFGLYIENHPVLRVDSSNVNVFIGTATGAKVTDAIGNTATGAYALNFLTTGLYNTANGYAALQYNKDGFNNTAMGAYALSVNSTGHSNTAVGDYSLYVNTTGAGNTAMGSGSLHGNNQGVLNTAIGNTTLWANTTGSNNTAVGSGALYANTTADYNVGVGSNALASNTTGAFNVAVGTGALEMTNGAWGNTAVGDYAGGRHFNGYYNTFIGSDADANGDGYYNSVAIGNSAVVTAPNQVRLGNTSTTSIGGVVGWTNLSDGRVKKNIRQNVPGLAFINKLKPVTYNLDLDAADRIAGRATAKDHRTTDSLSKGKMPEKPRTGAEIAARTAKQQVLYTGFVAQEVEKAANEIGYDFSGVDVARSDKDLYGLRYAEFVTPLVKAVQELSKENDELKSRLEKLEALMNTQSATAQQQSIAGNQAVKIVTAAATLKQNTPNPFNRTTTIHYTLPQQFSAAKIVITDKSGKAIKEVKVSAAGNNSLTVDASTFAAGIYQYSLIIDGKLVATKQMITTK